MSKEENERQHLDYVQGIITRMAGNTFKIKSFCMSIVTLLSTLRIYYGHNKISLITALSVIACALADAYYLQLERKYRELYKQSVEKMGEDRPLKEIYNIDVSEIKVCYGRCLSSKSILMPYGIILIFAVLATCFIPGGSSAN